MTRMFAASAVVCLALVGAVADAQGAGSATALDRLKQLAGDWEGTYEWSGARTETGAMNVTYYVTGNGSAVVENLTTGGVPSMTSVYHVDGVDLRMTHFCGAQNQPRLRATRIDPARGAIDFELVDITNLASPEAPHVHGLEIRFVDADHITLTFLFRSGGRESRELITLKHRA